MTAKQHFNRYWFGLIDNCKSVKFTDINIDKDSFGNIKNHIYKIRPMSIEDESPLDRDGDKLHVIVERYSANQSNMNPRYAEFVGEYTVPVGSYLDVCDSIITDIGLEGHSVLYGADVPDRY